MKNTLYKGETSWTNNETGEVITTQEIVKRVDRKGFMITYMSYLINLFDKLGTKKFQVVKYIFENMDLNNNTLLITTRELAIKSDVSRQVVIDTLKILEDAELISRKTGTIMIHPHLAHRGSNQKEKFLLARFEELGK